MERRVLVPEHHRRRRVGGCGKNARPLARAEHYTIETNIDRQEIRGVTTIALMPAIEGLRVLPLHISDALAVESATFEGDAGSPPLGIVRDELQQGWYERMFNDGVAAADVAIVFPEPLRAGVPVQVRIAYGGRQVLQGSGGYYSVRARQSWYPNIGTFSDPATYEMTFLDTRAARARRGHAGIHAIGPVPGDAPFWVSRTSTAPDDSRPRDARCQSAGGVWRTRAAARGAAAPP